MAPEYPPKVVIFDAYTVQDDLLQGQLDYIESPDSEQRLRIRWHVNSPPPKFIPVGNGVAYVYGDESELYVLPVSADAMADALGGGRFQWTEGLQAGLPELMFILILPPQTTLIDPVPKPIGTKLFNDRVALYWMLQGDAARRTRVAFTLKTLVGDRQAELLRLNQLYLTESPVDAPTFVVEDEPTRILFLAANPDDLQQLRADREKREIEQQLRSAKRRDQFHLCAKTAVRPLDLTQALLDEQPHILHFSGHGSEKGGIYLENNAGTAQFVAPATLAALLALSKATVRCVILNACYTAEQAEAIAEQIDYVIGMGQAVEDGAALAFSVGFYQALGAGQPIEDAYQYGCAQMNFLDTPAEQLPTLLRRQRS